MVQVQRRFLILLGMILWLGSGTARSQKFYPDDPHLSSLSPTPVGKPRRRSINNLYDFVWNSIRWERRPAKPARGINTLGEVPDSAWFTNRHGRNRLSPEELRRGPGIDNAPVPPFLVVGAKTEGITPGFQMTDARGTVYFVKPDPVSNPEMATAADVIGARFFYAIGYNTPENYIVHMRRSDLTVSRSAMISKPGGRPRRMTEKDIDEILEMVPRRPDGTYRLMASLALAGEAIGPFRYEGTRDDDPNDTVPHELRRDLRGLHVFCAWLNHTDAKAGNSIDMVVEESGVRFVRHYLIDFGAILGSDSDRAKNARFGNEYIIPPPGVALRDVFGLGLISPSWERAYYPHFKATGRFEAEWFDPEKWKSNYPNPAFLSRQPEDEYWAATHVMAFTDEDIRILVETGEFSNPRTTEYIARTLSIRRDKIGRACLSKVLPLDRFLVADGRLQFTDLAVLHRFAEPRRYEVQWNLFDNDAEKLTPLPGEQSFQLPRAMNASEPGSYFAARIRSEGETGKTMTVYVRKTIGGAEVVGIDREGVRLWK
jgi:hypothetical protein